MNVLICGVGRYARNVLERLGEGWDVTLVDTSAQVLTELAARHASVTRTVEGDVSSPVVLEEARLERMDFLLAMTGSDKVNLAAVRFAAQANVPHILALVCDPALEADFRQAGARTILPRHMVARNIYQYLQDPRISICSLAGDAVEIVEFVVDKDNWIVGLSTAAVDSTDWRVAGVFREGELLRPRDVERIALGDRMVLIGQRNFFRQVCSLLQCADMPFPLSYGRGLLLALAPDREEVYERTMSEALYLARNTRVGHITLLREEDDEALRDLADRASHNYDVRACVGVGSDLGRVREICQEQSIGLVVIRPFEKSFFRSLHTPEIISLAHSMPSPLLIARHSDPYKRILVPFNATPKAEAALEVAIDLAGQLKAGVDAVVVEEPEFIHESEAGHPREKALERVRHIAHLRKAKVGELTRTGNPVREVTELIKEGGYGLVVLGSTKKDKNLFTPHVGELIAEKAPCSTLIVT